MLWFFEEYTFFSHDAPAFEDIYIYIYKFLFYTDVNVWRDKYKALSRELENTRRRLTDQAEEEIQDLMNQKRCMEKQVGFIYWLIDWLIKSN